MVVLEELCQNTTARYTTEYLVEQTI